ncbi:GtrA family protein [Rhodococcus sp. D2-41]|uniref:GtrA family protein n=1 Tax=Speluncibacter jeojiensis TaxID=2710754 RepID=A0A9X4M704_9ACTN|nr:GtrA family protein [Rhodococcus sp. D2-41]MDG3009923.1 GtrA family protein [Rhodococcus sp. D2-41]MDG3017142.1 GtrA family protein [Corynebacteriales bacterium D3-21]
MSFVDGLMERVPQPVRAFATKYTELIKFLMVGGTTFVVTTVLFYVLKLTILSTKPVTANVIAVLVATILSYVLNREWAFQERGGRESTHEALLFFLISGIGLAINQIPLWISSYVFDLRTPDVSLTTENIADFISGMILGTLLATVFRWWAFRRFVFPEQMEELRREIVDVERVLLHEETTLGPDQERLKP